MSIWICSGRRISIGLFVVTFMFSISIGFGSGFEVIKFQPIPSLERQTVKKLKESPENRLNDNHSPIGIRDKRKDDLVFSQSGVRGNWKIHSINAVT